MAKVLSKTPAPDRLYRIQRGNALLRVAGRAYSVGAGGTRLRFAQLINRHPFNWRVQVSSNSSFNRKFFPEGIVTFMPRFSCNDADFNDPSQFPTKGKCFAILFIPPETDIWMPPPPEVVQPDAMTCWAAAIFSWSQAVSGAPPFASVDDVIDTFRAMKIRIPEPKGAITRKFVNRSGGLVRWPKVDVDFDRKDGRKIKVKAGRITIETLAAELGASFEIIEGSRLRFRSVTRILEKSDGPVIGLKFTPGEVGHAVVIFGASPSDKFIGEMNPLPMLGRPTGPAFGPLNTRWLPTFRAFSKHKSRMGVEEKWEEFVFLFREK